MAVKPSVRHSHQHSSSSFNQNFLNLVDNVDMSEVWDQFENWPGWVALTNFSAQVRIKDHNGPLVSKMCLFDGVRFPLNTIKGQTQIKFNITC